MYRYHFDVSLNAWLVQFLKLGIVWMTVKQSDGKPLTFDTLEAAKEFVQKRGIDKHYVETASERVRQQNMPVLYGTGAR